MIKKVGYYISLGAGNNQYPLIKAAKQKGFSVIGVDTDEKAPGFNECDIRIQESIFNYRKIYFKISMALMQESVIGGFSASFGNALLSWSFLAERFKLNGLSRTQTESLIDKLSVRDKISRNPDKEKIIFRQPAYLPLVENIHKEEIDNLNYPLIIKNRWGYGKKNIFRMDDYNQIKRFLTKRNLKELRMDPVSILIEEEILGDEITVTGMVEEYKYHLIIITDKKTTDYPPFIEKEHIFPSKYLGMKEDLERIHQNLVEILDIPFGPVVSEFRIRDGIPYLIEISPQIPGEYIARFMIPRALNYDLYAAVVDNTTGGKIPPSPMMKPKFIPEKNVRVEYFLEGVSTEEWEKRMHHADFGKILNENPHFPPRNNLDRFGVMGFVENLPKGKN